MAKCTNCGKELAEGAKFCMYCGSQQRSAEDVETTAEAEAAAQADRVAEMINAAAPGELTLDPAEGEPEQPADKATELSEQPTLETLAATMPKAPTAVQERPTEEQKSAVEPAAPVYTRPAYTQPSYSAPAQPIPPQRTADPDKPGKKSKWQIMSSWGTFGALLLMGIPVIGLIFMIVWACGGCRKYAKRNLARAVLLMIALCLVVTIAAALVLRFAFPDVLVNAFEYLNPGYTIVF